jgi:XTP/dITP diphosphohydrolase
MTLPFVSSSPHKVAEFQAILAPFFIEPYNTVLTEIQSIEVEEVVQYKILEASRLLQVPCLVEDTGLYLKTLGGFPGALVKFYSKALGIEGISKLHGGTPTWAKTAIGYFDGHDTHIFVGTVQGTIATTPSKVGSAFGWDPIFIPQAMAPKTFAELTTAEKNGCSMRYQALQKLKAHLEKYTA